MKPAELIFVAALVGGPLWLMVRAWSKYFGIDPSSFNDRLQMQAGVVLATLSTSMWVIVLGLMLLQDFSAKVKSIAQNVAPGPIGVVNLLLCAGSLACAQLGRRSNPNSSRLRFAIAICGGSLMLIWLFVAANPH